MSDVTHSERIGPMPPGVSAGAAAFYRELHAYAEGEDTYYDAHEVEMIRQLVLAKDRLDQLDTMLVDVGAITSAGEVDAEGRLLGVRERLTIMREQRQAAVTFGRQVGQLRLPVGLADAAGARASGTSQHARDAARARWGDRGGRSA